MKNETKKIAKKVPTYDEVVTSTALDTIIVPAPVVEEAEIVVPEVELPKVEFVPTAEVEIIEPVKPTEPKKPVAPVKSTYKRAGRRAR